MAGKISELDEATKADNADCIELLQGGVNKKLPLAMLFAGGEADMDQNGQDRRVAGQQGRGIGNGGDLLLEGGYGADAGTGAGSVIIRSGTPGSGGELGFVSIRMANNDTDALLVYMAGDEGITKLGADVDNHFQITGGASHVATLTLNDGSVLQIDLTGAYFDADVRVGGNLHLASASSVPGGVVGTITGKFPVYDSLGALLGYVPVYDDITGV